MIYPFVNLFREGGIILYPILILAVLVFHVGFGRLWHVNSLRKCIRAMRERLGSRDAAPCVKATGNQAIDSFVNFMHLGNRTVGEAEQKYAALIRSLSMSARDGTSILSTGIVAAPLLGLLGTIMGMHRMFMVIGEFGFGSPAIMADGIATALQASLTGLTVAVAAIFMLDRINNAHNELFTRLHRDKNELIKNIVNLHKIDTLPRVEGERMNSGVHQTGPEQQNPEINLAPFVDTIMILLIFFVVTANLYVETGVTVSRPRAQSAVSAGPKAILVGITRDGTIHLYGRQTTIERLGLIMEQEVARQPDATVVIVADRDGAVGRTVEVIDKCTLAGIQKVSIAANKELD